VSAARALCVVLALLAACGTPASTPPPAPRARHAEAAGTSALRADDLKALLARIARAPEALLELADPHAGLALIRALHCEREEEVDQAQRLCGDELAPMLRTLQPELAAAIVSASDDEQRIHCQAAPEPGCRIDPSNECEPLFELSFAGTHAVPRLRAIVERDDWQALPETRAPLDRRIAQLLAAPQRCP
jgi:hypothetical protein